ncbi:hypothetical protein INT45_012758 [Circinella minor]|uniref:Uncharacterized protein n=1 Tax=Circinella minor TaxID=1195481 RepID=A0A8H7S6V4_9FUNG|nr:hypothetical protein INT45_012758 [Circinella minor]
MEDVLKNEQSRQEHRHNKRRDSYDSAESSLDDFEVHLAAYELDVEENWRRLIPMTCDANRRAWLLSTMKKLEITNWILFHAEGLVFNYLCSLNRQYRKKAWTLVANHHGNQIPNKLEPRVQMVQSLAALESSSDNSSSSDSNSDSDAETDSDGEKPHNKCRRTNNTKSKGKGKALLFPKKNACFLHLKSNHTRFDCEKLKEVLHMSRNNNNNNNNNWQQNNNNKFGSRSFFGPSNRTYYNNSAGPSNSNLCRFCRCVPYVRGHECQELLRARRSNINNNNNNNMVRSYMTHLSSQVEDMLSVNDDELMETSSNNNKGTILKPIHYYNITHALISPQLDLK